MSYLEPDGTLAFEALWVLRRVRLHIGTHQSRHNCVMLDICRKTVNHLWPDALRDRGALCNDLYKTTLLIHCHQGFGLASSEVANSQTPPSLQPQTEPKRILTAVLGSL